MPHPDLTLPENRNLTPEERIQASLRTAMPSPAKLKEWLVASGRTWLVFNSIHLVDSMDHIAFDEKCREFQTMIANYRDHRSTIKTGDTETIAGKVVDKFHPETLTVTELDRAIRYLISQASTLDPTWSLGRDPA